MSDNEEVALVPVKKKTNTELMIELAKTEDNGNTALLAVLDRMSQLETAAESALTVRKQLNNAVKEVISAARDLEQHYTVPGEKRFRRVVRLRKALDELEDRVRKGRL